MSNSKESISITRALAEINLLHKRIENKVDNASFVTCVSKKHKHLVNSDNFANNAKADFQSIEDLFKRRNAIKSAIIESNANTKVKIGGKF